MRASAATRCQPNRKRRKSRGGDRLDLGAQPLDRVAVDARQQPPLAPFLALAPGVNRPRIAKPSVSSAASAAAISPARARAARRARPGVTGPRPSSRPRRISTSASSRDQSARRRSAGAAIAGSSRRLGPQGAGTAAAARPRSTDVRLVPSQPRVTRRCAARAASSQRAPSRRWPRASSLGEEAEPDQRVVQLVGVGGLGPGLRAHARDRLGIEPAEIGRGLRGEPAPAHHRLRAALLERRIVEIGVGPGRQHLERERRGLGQVARDDSDLAGFEPPRAAVPGRRCPSPRRGSRRWSGAPADGRASRARRRGSRRRRSGRETPRRSGPRRPCARAAAAPSCRRGSAAARARRRRPSASASSNIGASSSAWISTAPHAVPSCR